MTTDETVRQLGDLVYLNPLKYTGKNTDGWETAEEYLSGEVCDKLDFARILADENPTLFQRNVKALEKVQPTRLCINEISFKIGSPWIPSEIYGKFLVAKLHLCKPPEMTYFKATDRWKIPMRTWEQVGTDMRETYGTSQMSATEIFGNSLNSNRVRVNDSVDDPSSPGKKKQVLNRKETILARSRQDKLEREFVDFCKSDGKIAVEFEKIYNEQFNRFRARKFSGDYIEVPGMSAAVSLRPHQKDVIARIMGGKCTLMAHEVGAGKTAAAAAAGVYLKRTGAANKPLYVVPKPIVGQWAREFVTFFPNAKVLVAKEKDFEVKNRRKFLSKCALGDFDAVIISDSQFEKIPLSAERQTAHYRKKIDEAVEA
ncbi:MAG: DEAD/DEAH box helicase family protein, partial [Oscillospiraceae bacterium]|nr:DEAD/DEAH box helicase family protein [Oscillospiraceae bacterium]